jgi:hypothetical protein
MANELTIRASLSFEKDGTSVQLALGPTNFDVAGKNHLWNRQNVGFAAEEALLLGDVAAGGYLIAKNRDATNYVEIRPNTGVADLVRLKPGDFCIFRLADDAVPYVQANTAAVELEYIVVDA